MKKSSILGIAVLMAAVLTSCGGKTEGEKPLTMDDYKDATAADSLLFYFGQLRAADYWQYTRQDSVMQTRESRDEYLRGVKAGLDAVRNSDAYNQGLYVGVQVAMNLQDFKKDFGVNPNRAILLDALTDGLRNDSVVDAAKANSEFRNVMETLNVQKEEADRKKASEALAREAAAKKWEKVDDHLYATAGKGGAGALLQIGQQVNVEVKLSVPGGRLLDARGPLNITVGENYPGPVTDALLAMKVGESRTFYATAVDVFGRYCDRYGLEPDSIVEIALTTAAVTNPLPEADQTNKTEL